MGKHFEDVHTQVPGGEVPEFPGVMLVRAATAKPQLMRNFLAFTTINIVFETFFRPLAEIYGDQHK